MDSTPAEVPFAYIWSDVLEELRFNAGWVKDQFAVGLIVGHHYRDPETQTSYVQIDGFIAGAHVPDGSAFSRHIRQEWRSAAETIRANFGEAEVVGWYVADSEAHPVGHAEVVLHNSFFNHPWQVGLLLAGDEPPMSLRMHDGEFIERPCAISRAVGEPVVDAVVAGPADSVEEPPR